MLWICHSARLSVAKNYFHIYNCSWEKPVIRYIHYWFFKKHNLIIFQCKKILCPSTFVQVSNQICLCSDTISRHFCLFISSTGNTTWNNTIKSNILVALIACPTSSGTTLEEVECTCLYWKYSHKPLAKLKQILFEMCLFANFCSFNARIMVLPKLIFVLHSFLDYRVGDDLR